MLLEDIFQSDIDKKIKQLRDKHGDDLQFDLFGLNHSESEIPRNITSKLPELPATGRSYKRMSIPLDKIYTQDQNGVSAARLLKLSNVRHKAGKPVFLKISNDVYWVIEGHHRMCLQILDGNDMIDAIVEINPNIQDI